MSLSKNIATGHGAASEGDQIDVGSQGILIEKDGRVVNVTITSLCDLPGHAGLHLDMGYILSRTRFEAERTSHKQRNSRHRRGLSGGPTAAA